MKSVIVVLLAMPPKTRTKGKQEIFQENQATLAFYWRISVSVIAIHTCGLLLFYRSTSWLHLVAAGAMVGAHYLAHRIMRAIARPILLAGNQLMDGGIDLSLPNGMGEHMKDVVLFSAVVQLLSLLSDYFWFLLLLAPIRAVHIIWPYLSPWLRSSPTGMESEKPKKKREKRIYK